MDSFINDGYQFKVGIDPVENVHGGIEFVYRPCSPTETAQYQVDLEGKRRGVEIRRVQARWLKKKLVSWSQRESSERLPEIEDSIFTGEKEFINPHLLSQIIGVVFYGSSPDYGEVYDSEEQEKN